MKKEKSGVRSQESSAAAKAMADRKGGFTLVELLAVITIIGVLAGLIIGASKYAVTKSKRSSAAARIAAMESALEDFKADNGFYPKQAVSGPGDTLNLYQSLNGLTSASSKKYFNFTGKEITNTAVIDPFGNEYQYVSPGKTNITTYDLWSKGPDGIDGTPDDIANWKANN
jgi:general secretion pathway protein G